MTKTETVRNLNDAGPQLKIIAALTELQQTMQSLPDAIATLTAQSLTPLETLQSEVSSALSAYDQISATQRETLDALTTEMTKLTAQKFKTIAAAQEKQVQRLQNTTADLQTEMQDYRALMEEQAENQKNLTAAYRMVVDTAENLSAEADRLRPKPWKTLILLIAAAAMGSGAVLAGQSVLNEQAQPSATIKQEAAWAQTVWTRATPAQRKELKQLAR